MAKRSRRFKAGVSAVAILVAVWAGFYSDTRHGEGQRLGRGGPPTVWRCVLFLWLSGFIRV